jgi:hypothetical protein
MSQVPEAISDQATTEGWINPGPQSPAVRIHQLEEAIAAGGEVILERREDPVLEIITDAKPAEQSAEPQDPWLTTGIRNARIQRRRWRG